MTGKHAANSGCLLPDKGRIHVSGMGDGLLDRCRRAQDRSVAAHVARSFAQKTSPELCRSLITPSPTRQVWRPAVQSTPTKSAMPPEPVDTWTRAWELSLYAVTNVASVPYTRSASWCLPKTRRAAAAT